MEDCDFDGAQALAAAGGVTGTTTSYYLACATPGEEIHVANMLKAPILGGATACCPAACDAGFQPWVALGTLEERLKWQPLQNLVALSLDISLCCLLRSFAPLTIQVGCSVADHCALGQKLSIHVSRSVHALAADGSALLHVDSYARVMALLGHTTDAEGFVHLTRGFQTDHLAETSLDFVWCVPRAALHLAHPPSPKTQTIALPPPPA